MTDAEAAQFALDAWRAVEPTIPPIIAGHDELFIGFAAAVNSGHIIATGQQLGPLELMNLLHVFQAIYTLGYEAGHPAAHHPGQTDVDWGP